LVEDKKTVFVLLKTPDMEPTDLGFEGLTPHLLGTLVLDSTPPNRLFHVDSEDDPYYQLLSQSLTTVTTPFFLDGADQASTLNFENARIAACLAVLIPGVAELVKEGAVTWEQVAGRQLLDGVDKDTFIGKVNGLGLPGRVGTGGGRVFAKSGYELVPVKVLNAKEQSALDGGSFLQALQPVATLIIPNGEEWIVKDEAWDDLRAKVVFPDGTSEAPLRPLHEEDVTVKIGFMWSAKPSYTEAVNFNGSDVNTQLQAIQAYVDYWNTWHMPPRVTLELVYGAHGFDVCFIGSRLDLSDAGTATSETIRLINTEKIAFFIGDMTDALTIDEAPFLAEARLLHCATSNPMVFRGSLNLGSIVVATVASPGQYGVAARSLVAAWPAEGRVVVSYERDGGRECLQRVVGFNDVWVDPPIGKPLGTWSTPRIPNDDSYRSWDDWARQIRQIRAYNASVIVHCGSARHFYSLFQEAVNQGMMEEQRTVFVLLKTPEVDLEEAGFPATLAQRMFGTLVLDETNLRLVAESEDDPYFHHVKDAFNSLNTPFRTPDGQRPALTLETAQTAACLAMLLPSLTERGNAGLENTGAAGCVEKFDKDRASGDADGYVKCYQS
ncbi:hypothetical protein HK102_003411, partial [Quaeritorhiza haematococci]